MWNQRALWACLPAALLWFSGTLPAEEMCYDTPPSHCPAEFCRSPAEPILENCKRYQGRIAEAEQQLSDIERLFVPVLNVAVNGPQSPPSNTANVQYQLAMLQGPGGSIAGAGSDGIQLAMANLAQPSLSSLVQDSGVSPANPYPQLRGMEQPRLDALQDGLQDLHTRHRQLVAALRAEQARCPTANAEANQLYQTALQEMRSCEARFAECMSSLTEFAAQFSAELFVASFEVVNPTCVQYEAP